jgi:hypothetical protein
MLIAFFIKGELDHDERAQVVTLLSRLFLQVARSGGEREVNDDAP